MKIRRLSIRGALLVLALAVSVQAFGQRVVAVGDVHGDVDTLAGILQLAGVIDADRHWSGGKTIFVQTGDLLDRGDHDRKVLDLMMALEQEAPKSGGRVISVLGNHEFMNLVGDLRYVSAASFSEYSGGNSPKCRHNAYERYSAWVKKHANKGGAPAEPQAEADWNARHPLGFVEQREQFSSKGKYGRWLRERPAMAQVGDVIFVHGGISPTLEISGVAEVNERIRTEVRKVDERTSDLEGRGIILPFFTLEEKINAAAEALKAGVDDPQLHPELKDLVEYDRWYGYREDGPLWFRGYSQWPEEEGTSRLPAVLARFGAKHIVVGHTPQQPEFRIRQRFGGQAVLIDTAISRAYSGGRPSALLIENGTFTALYADGRKTLLEDSQEHQPKPGDVPK